MCVLGAGDALQDPRPVRQPFPLQPHQAARPVRRVGGPLRDARLQAQALQGQDQVEDNFRLLLLVAFSLMSSDR